MKWFQHQSGAHWSKKLRQLIRKYGLKGYGLYWMCLEIISKEGSNYRLKPQNDWKFYLMDASLETDEKFLEQALNYMGEIKLIDAKSLSKGELYIPKLKDYSDNWTRYYLERDFKVKGKELSTIHKITLHKITSHYIRLKRYNKNLLVSKDYQRYTKEAQTLYIRSGEVLQTVLDGLDWITRQDYAWEMSTLLKKWPDYLKYKESTQIEDKRGEESKKKLEQMKKESEENPIDPDALKDLTKDIGNIK